MSTCDITPLANSSSFPWIVLPEWIYAVKKQKQEEVTNCGLGTSNTPVWRQPLKCPIPLGTAVRKRLPPCELRAAVTSMPANQSCPSALSLSCLLETWEANCKLGHGFQRFPSFLISLSHASCTLWHLVSKLHSVGNSFSLFHCEKLYIYAGI